MQNATRLENQSFDFQFKDMADFVSYKAIFSTHMLREGAESTYEHAMLRTFTTQEVQVLANVDVLYHNNHVWSQTFFCLVWWYIASYPGLSMFLNAHEKIW